MIKYCEHCHKIFETEYPSKKYCSETCARHARFYRDESFYDYAPESSEPLYSFNCKNCGKEVFIYSRYDQRNTYCCGICCADYTKKRERMRCSKHKSSNIGMSGGMSLGSLRKLEARSVDRKEKVIEVRICPICGKKFDVDEHHKKYCGVECAVESERRKKAERQRQYRARLKRK